MRKSKPIPIALLPLLLAIVLSTAIGPYLLQANESAQSELDAVWQRVRRSGAYAFNADIVQHNTPQATVLNAGRKSTQNSIYLEGETDINAESLHLMLWSEGGSVGMPGTGTEIQVTGDQAQARRGGGAWEEIDDFTGLFAPGGDFLAYTQAAKNVVRHAPETRSTPLGSVEVTRYTFDIDGRSYAMQMHEQMRKQAMRDGLPANVRLDLPRVYADMTGTGELWVGRDGLPLRQTFALEFPPDKDQYVSSAQVTVDFSDFAPVTMASGPGALTSRLFGSLQAAGAPHNALSLLSAAMALWLVALVVLRRQSKVVYATVAVVVVLSMLATPLLTARRVVAYSDRQEQKRSAQEERSATQEAQDVLQEQVRAASMDPHADALAAAQSAAEAEAVAAPMAQSNSQRYFDPSCESDPTGDIDGDGLTNLSECLLGTLPGTTDTDTDGVSDAAEVQGFTYKDQTWYTDPLNPDTNNDGLGDGKEWYLDADGNQVPDDTDGDGTPDLWDDDNDGDGVRDSLDLSPYVTTKAAAAFSDTKPFELTIDNLVESELVRVEFQIRPTDANHLWYSQSVLDWPQGDQQAQLQDVDGKTFADLDPTLPPWPNANGDTRLIPMLEITMAQDAAHLPPQETLSQFGISVQQTDDNTQTAYVPVQLVSDDTGDANVAFYARMFYQAGANWGAAHQVRLVWLVQMLNDVCGYPDTPPADFTHNYDAKYWPPQPNHAPSNWNAGRDGGDWPGKYSLTQDGLCQFYSAMNETQVIQTYDDEWYFTGLHVMEEHSADMALIYEDPAVTGSVETGYDSPLYVDTLYGLLYGMDNSFLAARDCDSTDANGNCVGNGQLDVTVDTLGNRFNHATNSYSADDPAYWGLPNVLSVVKNGVEHKAGDGYASYADIPSYDSIDLAMMDTTTIQTMHVLTSTFASAWSESNPITPTLMLASQQTYRDLNLDQFLTNDPNLKWNSSALTMDLPQSGSNQVSVDTMVSVKWTPYAYDPATGWAAADISDYYDELSTQLAASFSDITDPTEAQTQQTMAQLFYMTVYGGDSQLVQTGDIIPSYGYALPDEPIYLSLSAAITKYLAKALDQWITFSQDLADITAALPKGSSTSAALSEYLEQKIFSELDSAKGIAGATFGMIFAAVVIADVVINYVLHDSGTTAGEALNYTVQSVLILYSAYQIYKTVSKVVKLANGLVEAGKSASFAGALGDTLTSDSSLISSSDMLSVVGLVISIGVAIGIFVYAWASGAISPGSIAFNDEIAATIAAIIVALVLFVLTFSVIGTILVSILALIDTILTLAGSSFTITGWFTKAIASVIYQYDLDTSQDMRSGQFDIELVNPEMGMIAGNALNQSLPLTTTLKQSYPESTDRLKSNSLVYDLNLAVETLSTSTGARSNDWTVSEYDTYSEVDANGIVYTVPLYQAVAVDHLTVQTKLSAGVNSSVPLWLNSAYALRGNSCWVGWCKSKGVSGHSASGLGGVAVLDVLPDTLSEFVDVSTWGTLGFLDADGDGMLPARDGGLDPDESTWDIDKDRLSDAYEVSLRSLSTSQGGAAVDPHKLDTDGDGLDDYAELRNGTDPGSRDSDGDGLTDLQEARLIVDDSHKLVRNDGSGWLIPYAYDATSGTTAQTQVWSDARQVDADNDGLSDLFEADQTTLDATPWSDPSNPLVYNPNVWSESPVALYLDNDSTNGFVKPGATLVYTSTTANNLSSGQELVGQLSLDLPSGVSGGPTSQIVDIQSGQRSSLVSTLTFDSSETKGYEFSSIMELTDYDQTRWSWDAAVESGRRALGGTAHSVAVTPVETWRAPYLMVTAERSASALTVNGYIVENDGTVPNATTFYTSTAVAGHLTGPDVACNENGTCLVVWGEVNDTHTTIESALLTNGFSSPTPAQLYQGTRPVTAPAVATDGTDFMVTWGQYTQPNGDEMAYTALPFPHTGNFGDGHTVSTLNTTQGAVAMDWTGSDYTAILVGSGDLQRVAIGADGTATASSVLGTGGGWPQSDGTIRPPALAYDAISDQSLLVYRDGAGHMAARILKAESSGNAFALVESGVDGNDLTVALSPDRKNSGWVLAWAAARADGTVEYRALSPTGSLRGDVAQAEQSALTTVGLSCIVPQPLLDLKLAENPGATVFVDSTTHDHLVTCGTGGDQCPQAGYVGERGNAASFNGQEKSVLVVPDGIALDNRSFTLSAWAKRTQTGTGDVILSQGKEAVNQGIWFGFDANDHFTCSFWDNVRRTQGTYKDMEWHHWVCSYDTVAQKLLLYRDGEPVSTIKEGGSTGNYVGSGPLYTGKRFDEVWYFDGLLQDVAIYDRVLSGGELQDVFSRPLAVYDLDETGGSKRFVNAADTGFAGGCSGQSCPTMGVPGVAYTAAQFDGNDAIVITPTAEVDTTYQWTFEDNDLSDWNRIDDLPITIEKATRNDANTLYLDKPATTVAFNLYLPGLPAHDRIDLSYDLYIMGAKWHGTAVYNVGTEGADFTVGVTGRPDLLRTSFSNDPPSQSGAYQLYPADVRNWINANTTLFEHSDCASAPALDFEALTGGANSHAPGTNVNNDVTPVVTFNTNCVITDPNAVAVLAEGTSLNGTSYLQDPKRKINQQPNNKRIRSISVGPAANVPGHGSTKEKFITSNGDSDNSVYSIHSTFEDASPSQTFTFNSNGHLGLDNVRVKLIKDANSFALRNSSFTLSTWAKRDGTDADDSQYLISQGTDTTNQGLRFGFHAPGEFHCAFQNDDLIVTVPVDNEWHHWACTYDVATKQRTLYRDGVQVGQDTATANYSGTGATYIGMRYTKNFHFKGVLDEIGIWTEALSADEVQELYDKVKVEDESVLICQLPAGTSSDLHFDGLTLRETTTRIGDISQTVTRTITVDNNKPSVAIQTLHNGQYVSGQDAVSIGGAATDPTSYIAGVKVGVDSGSSSLVDVSGTAAWAYAWDPSGHNEGAHTVQAQSVDAVGHESASQSVQFLLDRTPPTVSLQENTIQPTQDETGRWYVPMHGSGSDPNAGSQPGSGVAEIEVLLQGQQEASGNGWQAATRAGESWSLNYTLPHIGDEGKSIIDPSGVYTATLRATDAVSNTTPADSYPTVQVTLDVAGPVLTVNQPVSRTRVISTGLTIGGDVSDLSTVSAVEVNLTSGEQIDALNGNILHLSMDENRASQYFTDQSGTNHNATCTGNTCPTVGQTGQRDSAFHFDGSDDRLTTGPDMVALSKDSFSIGVWVKTTGTHVGIVTKSNNNSNWEAGERSFYLDGSGVPNFVGNGNGTIHGTTPVNDDAWHHVLVTWAYSGSGTAGTGKIYVDGVDDTASSTNYAAHNADLAGANFKIGVINHSNEASHFYAGLMDEFVVYQRALAAYEVADLYAYGHGTWAPTTLDGNTWSYTLPVGANGIEGFHQINVRGTDSLGNVTPLSGQRAWRGEIDTKAPAVQFLVTSDESGSTPSTRYECIATDFNLLQESDANGDQTTSCVPGSAAIPAFRNSDLTLTTYDDVDAWYAATITDTSRLYRMEAVRTYSGDPASDLEMTACDRYNHCTTVEPSPSLAAPLAATGAEVLSPASGSVLTTTNPITVTGDAYANTGLQALSISVNGSTAHTREWETDEVPSELWSFIWTPPGEGIYRFEPLVDDWAGEPPPTITAQAQPVAPSSNTEPGGTAQEQVAGPPAHLAQRIHLPFVAVDASSTGGLSTDMHLFLPIMATEGEPVRGTFTGTVATLFVDLTPPTVSLETTSFTPADDLGRGVFELAGTASDSVWLHRVDVRIDDGPWQRAGVNDDGTWQFPWRTGFVPQDTTYAVSVRATDLAGRTATLTETVMIAGAIAP